MAPAAAGPYDGTMADDDQFEPKPAPEPDDGNGDAPEPNDPLTGDDGLFPITRDRFAQAVISRVRRRFPLVKIGRARQPFSVRVNGHVASLENLYRISKLKPGDLQHQIERWAVELLRASEGTPDRQATLDEVGDRLLPMILPAEIKGDEGELIEPIDVSAGPPASTTPRKPGQSPAGIDSLVTQPLVPGLRVGYVIDGDRTIAYVPWEALERWDISVDRLHERAIANLLARSEAMNAHAAQDDEGEINLILFQTLDGFDASRLLLPNLHERLRDHLGSPFIAAIPNRDILLCFRHDEDTVSPLRDQIRRDYRTMPHQVTDRLMLVTADGIAPYD